MIRLSWILTVFSKANDKYPYNRYTEEEDRGGGGHVTTQGEIRAVSPDLQPHHQMLEEARDGISP